jgi:1,2-diacylglycerol 3-alpha-glucosyltransferase
MKIVMFSNLFHPVVSGSATQSQMLARELVKRGHQVSLMTAHVDPSTPSEESVMGVMVHRMPSIRLPALPIALNFPWLSITFTPANQGRIADLLRRYRPDVLHLHNHMFDMAFSAVRMKRNFNLPLVTTLHTVIKHSNPAYNLVLYPADRIFLKHSIINQSDQLLYPDQNIADYAAEAFNAAATHGSIVPYGIGLPTPSHTLAADLTQRFNLADKRVILSLGHLHEIRNRRDLIEALPYILKVHPNTVLLIVGTVATETPRQLAQKLGVEHAVIFAGAMPHDHVAAFLSLADMEAHWLNQEEPEKTSLGIASLEAMSAGVTILSAANINTYGAGVLKDGENLVMIRPQQPESLAQTIIDLLNDPTKRQRIGQQARQTIQQHFSWDSVCQHTVTSYQRAIDARRA